MPSLTVLLPLLSCLLFVQNNPSGQQLSWEFGHSSNFRQASNWVDNRLPCPRDSVRLPSGKSPNLIGLTRPLLVQRELLLPSVSSSHVALILFDGGGLKAFDEADSEVDEDNPQRCSSDGRIRDSVFNLTDPLDWFGQDNWIHRGSTEFDALPVDKLPGPCDAVQFRDDATFFVKMLKREESLKVGELKIASKSFSGSLLGVDLETSPLEKFWLESPFVRRQFVWSDGSDTDSSPFSVDANQQNCDVPLPIHSARLMSRVCAAVSASGVTSCWNPIPASEVLGACQDLCGSAVLIVQTEIGLRQLRKQLLKAVDVVYQRRSNLRLSAFRTSISKSLYQLVLMRNEAGDAGQANVLDVLHWLERNASSQVHHPPDRNSAAADMQLNIVKTLMSGDVSSGRHTNSPATAAGVTAGLTIGFILLIVGAAIIGFIFVGRKRGWLTGNLDCWHLGGLWRAWQQWRHQSLQETGVEFSTSTGRVGFALSDTSSSQHESRSRTLQPEVSVDLAFTNPAYDVTQPELDDSSTVVAVGDHEM